MTGLIFLGLVPILAAAVFAMRAFSERRARLTAERALQAILQRGDEQDAERLRFLGIVAHELRSPLSAIMGYQELLADGVYGPIEQKAQEPLDRIARAARQLLTLTDGMEQLAGAKESAFGDTLPTDVTAVVHESLANAEREAAGRGLKLEVVTPPTIAPIRTDAERTGNALDLVLYAAIKMAQPGTLYVKVELNNGALTMSVRGPGLDRQPLASDPATPNAMPPITSGAGFRLAIARRLVESLGGTITGEGSEGEAALMVRLPVR